MQKKLLSLVISCFIGLLGCSSNEDQKTPDGKTIITFWHTHNDDESGTLDEILKDYEKQHPDIKVEAQQVPFSDAENKYKTVSQAKNAPDIFRSEIAWTAQFASLGYLMALDMFMTDEFRKPFLKAPLKYNYYDGHYWGVPQVTDCLALFYNKRIFKDSGLEVPKTTDELVSTGKKLTDAEKNKYAFFYRGDPYWFLPFMWSFGGGMVSEEGNILIDGPDTVKAVNFLIDLRVKYKIMPLVVDFANDYDNQQTGFKTGKYAMIINGPWSTSDILQGEEFKNPENLGITRIPAGPKGFASPVGGHNLVISANTKHLEKTWDLVNFISLPENQAKFAIKNNLLPTRIGTYDLPEVRKNHLIADFKYVLEAANNRPVIPEGGALFVDLKQPYQAALLKEKTAEQALGEVATAWKKLLAK